MMKQQEDKYNAALEEMATLEGTTESVGKVVWYRGAPEIILPMQIHDGFRAEFRLALYDGERNAQQYAEIGAWEPSSRRSRIKITELETCLLKVGTTPPNGDGAGGNREITALIDSTGESGTLTAGTDFAEWDFDFPEQTRLDFPLATAGSYDCTLAKREETVDGKTKLTGVLRLELESIGR